MYRKLFEYESSPSTNESYPDENFCYIPSYYLQFLNIYYIPFIVAFGFVGNFLLALVFLTTHLKLRSSSYYLTALSIADFIFLFVVLLVYLSSNNIVEVFNRNGWCQFFVYVSSVCASLSVWLTVAFTVERFIAVKYPLQRPAICTVRRAKIIVFSLVFVAIASQSYVFWIAGIIRNGDKDECEMLPEYEILAKVVNAIDTITTLIVPVFLIVTMNTMIARSLLHFNRRLHSRSLDEFLPKEKRELQATNSQSSTSNRHGNSQDFSTKSNSSKKGKKDDFGLQERTISIHIRKSTKKNITIYNQENINKMLLIISSVFIALNFPSYLIRLYVYFGFTIRQRQAPEKIWCLQQYAMLLYYTNFCINFMLYALCGATFRHCLWQLLRGFMKKFTNRKSVVLE